MVGSMPDPLTCSKEELRRMALESLRLSPSEEHYRRVHEAGLYPEAAWRVLGHEHPLDHNLAAAVEATLTDEEWPRYENAILPEIKVGWSSFRIARQASPEAIIRAALAVIDRRDASRWRSDG